jgi:two-component system, LytTR family, response regulator
MTMSKLRSYLVDDEELPLSTLRRMLITSGRADIVGYSTDPLRAIEEIQELRPDALFLDIHMPEIDGFELLSRLQPSPFVIFTTAYDQHALRAFETNSVDYLLKPIEERRLMAALDKLERRLPDSSELVLQLDQALERIVDVLKPKSWLTRIPCQKGRAFSFIEVQRISHIVAEGRHSYAWTEGRQVLLHNTLTELELRLDPANFLRVHRSTIVNLRFIDQVNGWFGGSLHIRLKDPLQSEITVSRKSVSRLQEALGM